jgi:hypothetical protein
VAALDTPAVTHSDCVGHPLAGLAFFAQSSLASDSGNRHVLLPLSDDAIVVGLIDGREVRARDSQLF